MPSIGDRAVGRHAAAGSLPGDRKVVAAAAFLVEDLDVVALAGGQADQRGLAARAVLAEAGVAVLERDADLVRGAVGGAEPEFGAVVGREVKAVLPGGRRQQPAGKPLAVAVARALRGLGAGHGLGDVGKLRVVGLRGQVADIAAGQSVPHLAAQAAGGDGRGAGDGERRAAADQRAAGMINGALVAAGHPGADVRERELGRATGSPVGHAVQAPLVEEGAVAGERDIEDRIAAGRGKAGHRLAGNDRGDRAGRCHGGDFEVVVFGRDIGADRRGHPQAVVARGGESHAGIRRAAGGERSCRNISISCALPSLTCTRNWTHRRSLSLGSMLKPH